MGFISDTGAPDFRPSTATLPPLQRQDEFADVAGAAFRQNNVVYSLYSGMANSGPFTPDPTHNPLDMVIGTKYEASHLRNFVGSRSEGETRAIMRRIDQEESDRKILEGAGMGGVLLNIVAGTLDPTIALPGSIAIKAGRGGYEFTRAAINVGAAGALQVGSQEALLQASQETRTAGESLMNVASGTVLAGLIGGAAARFLSRSERQALETSLDRARADMDAHANPQPAPVVQPAAPPLIPEAPRAAEPLGLAQSVGAAAADTRSLEMQSSIPGTSRISPTRYVLEAESVVARRVMADTAETPYSYKGSVPDEGRMVEGVRVGARDAEAATQGPPVDRIVKMQRDGLRYEVNSELDRLFTEYRFGAEAPALPRIRAGIDDILGRAEGKMSYTEFKKQVGQAAMFGDASEIPQVTAAAQLIRQKVFDPWAARAEAAVEGFERMTPAEGETWFPHSWNKEKIKQQRPEFTDKLVEKYREDQTAKAAIKERLIPLNRDLQAITDAIGKAKTPERKAALEAEHTAIRAKIEAEIAAWEGKSVKDAKAALKAREKYAEKTGRAEAEIGRGPVDRLEAADAAVDRAVKRILADELDKTDNELRSVAQQTVDRILGSPDGRLPYDVFSNDTGRNFGGTDARGSLARRQLNVTNQWARDWIEDDIEHVVASHLRTFVPDVVLAERFGDPEMSMAMRAVNEDYARLIDQARGNEKKVAKLGAERDAVIQRLAGVRDRIRGVYGWNPDTANMGRIAANLKVVNNMTSMGMSAIASISDFAGTPIRHGLMTTFNDAWAPFLKSMIAKNEGLEQQKHYIRSLGLGVDTALNLRQHALDDIIDGYRPQSRVERALQWTGDRFFVANGLAPLTDLQKQLAGSVVIPETIRASKAITEGKATKAQIRDLADAGIDGNMATRIHRQIFELGHGQKVDGVMLPNTADWTDKAAAQAFDGAVARAIDINVVTPGQEKPLMMSRPVGSLLLQFKSFPAAATERILISNLQRRDAKALSGMITSIALGMLSYKINSVLGGKPVSDDPKQWVKEGINRSGITGWLEEGNGMAAKLTRGTVDVHRLYGADKPLSRYASRSLADAFLGPTAGKIAGIGQVGGAAFSGEWNQSDTTALRRLLFFQNLAWLRGVINGVESGANNYFNIPEKATKN